MLRRHEPTPPALTMLIHLGRKPGLHPTLMLQPIIPPHVDGHIQQHQHGLGQTGDPTTRLHTAVALEIDDALERLLDLHGALIAAPAPQIVAVLAGAVRGRDGDPHADVGGEDGGAGVGAVFVGGVGGADAAHVRGHDDGGDDEGDCRRDEEDGGGPSLGLFGPGPAARGAGRAGDDPERVAGGEEFAEGDRHGGDHVEG
jgi:hypothetical protein